MLIVCELFSMNKHEHAVYVYETTQKLLPDV